MGTLPNIERLGQLGEPGIILYDGVCVLCAGGFKFVASRDTERRFFFTAIQSPYGRALAQRIGIDPDNPETNAVLLDGQIYLRSDSTIATLGALPGWRWIGILKIVPKPFRNVMYRLIARNRYNLFGKHSVCDLGGAKYADRIVS